MKKIVKITFISFVLIVSPLSSPKSAFIQAASVYDFQIKNDLFFHGASPMHTEKIALFQNHLIGIVHAVKNKWASVEYQARLNTMYGLTQTNKSTEINTITSTQIISSLLPKTDQSYTYEPSFQGPEKTTYIATKNPYFDNAVNLLEDEYTGYTYIESPKSFTMGDANSDVFYFSLDLPMNATSTIRDMDYEVEKSEYTEVVVVSTTEIVHTKAGMFNNVVVLNYPNGSTLFIAKGYGIIKITDYEGNTSTELIAVEN
ncbi:hypothetical protein [Solibacillus sp. FSL K6-1523]|uniref:hypothetical protein n=1 Tax=Solibacillus sp. FSL K6-1523 TaxID=2921471 RepID=UPI0030F6E521